MGSLARDPWYDGGMIPQADLDRALARWKSRQTGQDSVPTPGPVGAYDDGQGAQATYQDAPTGEITGDTSSGVIPIEDEG